VKRLAFHHLQALHVDTMAAIKLQIAPGKIVTHNPDQLDRAEKAGGHCRMACGTAQQPWIFSLRRFD